jgi:two-component system NtrC family sensor kinase
MGHRMNIIPPNPTVFVPLPGETSRRQVLDLAALGDALPQLLDAISDAVVVVNTAGQVLAANRRFTETFGPAGRDLAGLECPLSGKCHSNGPSPSSRCLACEITDSRQPKRLLQVLPDATGQQRRWEATMNPMVDESGTVLSIVEVWRDVTERTQLEAQLSHSERLASLGMLAAGVAHEINNPLASVLAGVESLQRWLTRVDLPDSERDDASEVLGLLEQGARRCRDTTDKLLLLGQPYASRPVWVDLNHAVRDTLALLSFATRRQHIQVNAELDPELPNVWGRESALRGVLMNLCLNAVQAMSSGGHLRVTTGRVGEDRASVRIEDDGPGIAPEHLNRIWDPFFTTKPVGQGTGLGLSITQRIVARHGGAVRVESAPGAGARFLIELPLQGSGGESA